MSIFANDCPISIYLKQRITDRMKEGNERYYLNELGLVHVWGIISSDTILTGGQKDTDLYTLNDLDITYDIAKQRFMLGVETVYYFSSKQSEKAYYHSLLKQFGEWLISIGELNVDTVQTISPIWSFFNSLENGNSYFDSVVSAYYYFKFVVENYFKEA